MADVAGKQPIRTLTDGDASVGVLDSSNTRITPLTDTQLRATAVPISAAALPLPTGAATESTLNTLNGKVTAVNTGAVTISTALPAGSNTIGKTDQGAAGASAWLVTGTGGTFPVTGPLTDTQLRASAVPVSGPLTDTQLRATAVPISASALPLPSGAATETTLSAVLAALGGATSGYANYQKDTLAGAGGTANHDTAISNANGAALLSVVCAATVGATYDVGVDPAGGTSYVTKWHVITSESSPTFEIDCRNFSLPNGATLRIVKTNISPKVGDTFDVHTTYNIQLK